MYIHYTLETAAVIKAAILSACDSIISKESLLNDLDVGCGDGDAGSTLVQGCQGTSSTFIVSFTGLSMFHKY